MINKYHIKTFMDNNKKIAIIIGCTVLFVALWIVTKGAILTVAIIGGIVYLIYKNN